MKERSIDKMGLLFGILFMMVGLVSSQVGKKQLPHIADKAFIAKFQVVDVVSGKMSFAVEKYDETQQKASMMTTDTVGVTSEIILDYAEKTVTAIQYSASSNKLKNCGITTMDTALSDNSLSDNFHYFGGWRDPNSKTIPHMFSSKNLLSMNSTKSFVYKGLKTIDGIKADHWSTSMSWSDDKDSFTLDLYFTPDPWQSAQKRTVQRIYPLRIEVTGTKLTDKGSKDIHRIYEYLDFTGYDRLDSSQFEIPDKANCNPLGDVVFRTVPPIPDKISYSREVVDSAGNVVFDRVVYDKKAGLMQIKSHDKEVLYDFNSGVYYRSVDMECTTRAIDEQYDENSKVVDYFNTDVGPAEFYLLNKTLIYRGQGRSRLIEAIAFSATGAETDAFDAYFAKMNWEFSPGFTSMPLSMFRDGKQYNFFNFKATATSLRTNYLWGACRSFKDRRTFKFTFFVNGHTDDLITDENVDKISDAIARQAMLAYSQVQILLWSSHYDIPSRSLTVVARLYSPPSPEFMYHRGLNFALSTSGIPSKSVTLDKADQDSIKRKSAEICEETTASTNFLCRSFDVCKTDGVYSMKMFSKLPKGVSLKQSSNCDHYSRSVDGDVQVSLDAALSNLQDAVSKGFLKLTVNGRWGALSISAVAVEPLSFRYDKSSENNKFKLVFEKSSLTKSESIKATSSKECNSKCLERDYYRCKATKFCYGTNECFLSADYPHKNSSKPFSACYISKRSFISEFEALTGLTMAYESKNAMKNVLDANDCAAKCLDYKDYDCKSFDYCKDTKECLLSKTHAYSVPADKMKKVTPSCTHYSKNYLLDFKIAVDTALSPDDKTDLQTISATRPEQCAHFCRTGSGQTCVQFDYCSDTNSCQISTVKTKRLVAHVPKHNCDTYTLTDAQKIVTNSVSKSKVTGNKGTGTTYSDGSFGGLAFAMVLVGLVIGAAIIFILHRRRTLSRFINY